MASSAQKGTNGSGGAAEPSSLRRPAEVRRLASALVERSRFAARHGMSFQGADGVFRRDLNLALGYKKDLDTNDYRDRYTRGGIAARVVELMPKETWGAQGFDIVENADPGVTTAFEQAFADLADRLDLWSRFLRADILAGLGRYSVILIGAAGPGESDLENPLPKMSKPDDILYLKPLAEDNAKIQSLVKDPKDPRFGEPEFYTIQLGKEDTGALRPAGTTGLLTKKTHWTRVIHVAEGLLEDDVYGTPRLRAVWNYLDDLAKVEGGGAEATWKRLHPRTIFDLDPELGDLEPDAENALVDEIEEIVHDLREHAVTRGVTPHVLSHAVQHFGPNADAVLQLICATIGVPKRIFLGSERGELASTQDRNDFTRGPVDSRRHAFGAPLVRQVVDRFIEYGALPEPVEYEVVLPALDELPEGEQAEIVAKFAAANKANVDAGGGLVITSNEMRDGVLSLGPIEEIEDTGTEALDDPDADADEEPAVTVNASLRAAKLRLCAARGLTFRRAEFDLADVAADEPEWKAVHRAADLHRDSLARAVLGAWEDGGDAIDAGELETALGEIDAERLTSTLTAALAGISPDSENPEAARQAAINDALAAGRADRVVALAGAGVTAAADRLAEILPDRLLATLIDGGLAALRSARSRGSWFRGAEAAAVEGLAGFSASFDSANPRAVDWAADRSSALITEIGPETLAAMRELIAFGIAEGVPPRQLARQIRQAVGLRSDQVRAVQNLIKRMAAAKPGDLIMAGKTRIRIPREGVSQALIDKRAGEYGRRLRQQRALLIARTETLTSANRGTLELLQQARDNGQLPPDARKVWISTPDDRTRPDHLAADGQVKFLDEPFDVGDGTTAPGMAPNCILSGEVVSGEFVAGLKAAYAGPAREIQTASGNRVRLTINHPVLTSEGLIPVGRLRQGMKLLGYRRGVGIGREADASLAAGSTRQAHDNHAPTAVQEVFEALALGGSRTSQVSGLALHGDARFTNGEVEVVRANRVLSDGTDADCPKGDQKFMLPVTDVQEPLVSRLGSRDLRVEGVDHAAAFSPSGAALALDGGGVQLQALPLQSLRFGSAAQLNVALTEAARQSLSVNAEFVRELFHRSSGEVALDEIVEIRDFDFAGHVFDLQSVTGWMLAGGIVVSNCRCAQGLATPEDLKRAGIR